jgi:acetolactate synthase-1/2/3 large subunit
LLAAGGAIGIAAAALSAPGSPAEAGIELGRYTKRSGVHGKMNGAQAAAAALACHGVRCVFGIPGAQTNELWDAFKARGVPYLLVANESSASVMADAAARATGEVGVFSVVPGPGLTNAMTGIGEALMDSTGFVTRKSSGRSSRHSSRFGTRRRFPARSFKRSTPPAWESRARSAW